MMASVSRGLFDKTCVLFLISSRSKATLLSVGQLEHFGQRDYSQAWAWLLKKVRRRSGVFLPDILWHGFSHAVHVSTRVVLLQRSVYDNVFLPPLAWSEALEPVVDVEGTCVSMQTEDLCVPLLDEVAALAEVRYAPSTAA